MKCKPRPIIGSRAELVVRSRGKALVKGSEAETPEAESFLDFGSSKDQTNLPHFRNFCKLRYLLMCGIDLTNNSLQHQFSRVALCDC